MENEFTLDLTNQKRTRIKQDLFLLENQLPYEVLKLLFEDTKNSNLRMEEKIKYFVTSHAPFPQGMWVKQVNHNPHHLLHYLQGVILGKTETPQKQDEEHKGCGRLKPKEHWRPCENVHELKRVGIEFKPSDTSYLTDISFNTYFGTIGCLKLPIISINISTMIIFLNLIAFESSNAIDNRGVISYLCFMDSLIDYWDDVKELKAVGILRNFVGDPVNVAQFFNSVGSKLVANPFAYKDVILQIGSHVKRHDKNRSHKWYVECKQKYFSSPWSIIALIAAVIGLLLTGIQAYTSLF